MRVVDLADRYHLTTAEALDLCEAAGIRADSSDSDLDAAAVERWLALAEEQRRWRTATAVDDAARAAAEDQALPAELEPAGVDGMPNGNDFGPIPPAPWEVVAGAEGSVPAHDAPELVGRPGELDSGWGMPVSTGPTPQVSPYAAVALALAIISFVLPFLTALGALWMAWLAKVRIRASHGRLTGEKLATAAQIAAGIGIALWLGLLGVALVSDYQTSQNRGKVADLQVDTEVRQWNELTPGTCVRVPKADLSVPDWQAVRCDGPHEGEVIGTRTVSRPAGDPYPGRASFIPLATSECKALFESYVGIPYAASDLRLGVVFPTVGNWTAETDRTIACIVYRDRYDYINGSVQGTGR